MVLSITALGVPLVSGEVLPPTDAYTIHLVLPVSGVLLHCKANLVSDT